MNGMLKLFYLVILSLSFMTGYCIAGAKLINNASIKRVLDGDTIEIHIPVIYRHLGLPLYIRIKGIDTPEKGARAQCEEENIQSLKAKLFIEQEVSKAKKILISVEDWDKYGGRILGDIILDGKSLSEKILTSGYGKPYNGKGFKYDWCEK